MSGSGISWAICKSAPSSRQTTTPAPHHSFFTGRMPFLLPNQQCQSTEGNGTLHLLVQYTTNVIQNHVCINELACITGSNIVTLTNCRMSSLAVIFYNIPSTLILFSALFEVLKGPGLIFKYFQDLKIAVITRTDFQE